MRDSDIEYMPVVDFFTCLDLEQKASFVDGHGNQVDGCGFLGCLAVFDLGMSLSDLDIVHSEE